MSAPAPIDWLLDRTVVGGYTKIGYRLRGLADSEADAAGRLRGKKVLVTGANSGIGAAASNAFAIAGAEVHMVSRNRERGEEARAAISQRTGSESVHLHICDMGDLEQVRELAASLNAELDGLDVLVHNAGALLDERQLTAQGLETTFAVHVAGPFLLTGLLQPLLRAAAESRVIFVASGGMYTARLDLGDLQLADRDFDGSGFYAHAKRAQVVLTEELGRMLAPEISVHAMHPGWAKTPGVASSLPRFNSLTGPLLRSPEAGADTIVWLAADPRPGDEPGQLWMDRKPRPAHRVPWTAGEPDDGIRLYEQLSALTGQPFSTD